MSQNVATIICPALGRGVTRSKRQAMIWRRKAAELGQASSCLNLAARMYGDQPYAREIGHVGEAAAGVATSAGLMQGHDIPSRVMTSVVHWLQKGGHDGQNLVDRLEEMRRETLEIGAYTRPLLSSSLRRFCHWNSQDHPTHPPESTHVKPKRGRVLDPD